MEQKRDYYNLFDIGPNATELEIKKAYRNLAVQHHPDKNQGDLRSESLFKEITQAYNVLLNPRDRALYDQFGHSLTPMINKTRGEEKGSFLSTVLDVAGDILEELFRNKNDRKFRIIRGCDIEHQVDLTLEEATEGKDVTISYRRFQTCDACKGTGALVGTRPVLCPECYGRGGERKAGSLMKKTTCNKCGGKGKVILELCSECHGEGRNKKTRELQISIPPETKEGERFKKTAEGEAGENGGPCGNLYILIKIKENPHPHSIF